MDFLRGLALGAQAYTEARARQQAREDALKQQAFQNLLAQSAADMQARSLSDQEKNQDFLRSMARQQLDWTKGEPGRQVTMAETLARLNQRMQNEASLKGLQDIVASAKGTIYAPSPALPKLPDKRGMLAADMLAPVLQPGAEQPAAAPAPTTPQGYWRIAGPGAAPEFVPETTATVAPTTPVAPATVDAAMAALPPVRFRAKAQQKAPLRQVPQGDMPLASEAQLREAMKGVSGFAMTATPQGTTYQYRPATEQERATTGLTTAQEDALRSEIFERSQFLPFRLKTADLQSQLGVLQVGLANWDLTQLKPIEWQTAQQNLQFLAERLKLARDTHQPQVDSTLAELAYKNAQIEQLKTQTGLLPKQFELDALNSASTRATQQANASTAAGHLAVARQAETRMAGEADRDYALRVYSAKQKAWEARQPKKPEPITPDLQLKVGNYLDSSIRAVTQRAGSAAMNSGPYPSAAEIAALMTELNDYSQGGLIPAQTAQRMYQTLLPYWNEAVRRETQGQSQAGGKRGGRPHN